MLRKKTNSLTKEQIGTYKYVEQPIETVYGETLIKRYLKIKGIGHGSYSKCFLVKNQTSESTYAVKIIPKNKLEVLIKQKLFYEIKIHQSLSHENIVYFDHWFEDESDQYIFMEYCSNGNLETQLQKQGGFMKEPKIKKYGWQIIQAIKYIHQQNILHRDLKPCNFYLDDNKNLKLGDFGFACQLANQYDRKRQSCGTPNYIAPQTISGYGYSFSSDVWSVGVILYRLKYGYCPFEGINIRQTLQNVRTCNYKFTKNIKVSESFKDLIQKIFTINYDDRITTQDMLSHDFFTVMMNETALIPQKAYGKTSHRKSQSLFSKMFSSKKTKQSEQIKPQVISNNHKNLFTEQSKKIVTHVRSAVNKSNSCQTLKQIKTIFKSKSKNKDGHFTTNSLQTIPSLTASSRFISQRQKQKDPYGILIYTQQSNRQENTRMSMMNDTLNHSYMKKQEPARVSRLNKFVQQTAHNISYSQLQSAKIPTNKNNNHNTNININKFQKLLQKIRSKHQLPSRIQCEKDIIIIHYNRNIKQLINVSNNPKKSIKNNIQQVSSAQDIQEIPSPVKQTKQISKSTLDASNNNNYTDLKIKKQIISQNVKISENNNQFILLYLNDNQMQQNSLRIMDHNGEDIDMESLPKVTKYIIQNQVSWEKKLLPKQNKVNQQLGYPYQFIEQLSSINTFPHRIKKILKRIANDWIINKDGVILKYPSFTLQQQQQPLMVGKIYSQDQFYATFSHTNHEKQGSANKIELLYQCTKNQNNDNYRKVVQQVGILRIYMGWVRLMLKKK